MLAVPSTTLDFDHTSACCYLQLDINEIINQLVNAFSIKPFHSDKTSGIEAPGNGIETGFSDSEEP